MKLVSTVFEVEPQHAGAFRAAALANAFAVERADPACRGVAIAEDPEAPGFFLTSALYASEEAAASPAAAEAGRVFEEAVKQFVKHKLVRFVDLG
ncbi:antibiotic biosynthesis monooxygenase [Methylopila sp. M107]|uniref:antibiotic biosynthesis monooxygenase n=1 Tax=Methylopila sp. M107 TaxID=1101190 RepID=UPI00037A0F25|nr:antibiotic biosynthesis monooxygenase [Methylopila sp. M107]